MSKVRVHELAKKMGKSNKEILDIVGKKDPEIHSHMASLTEELVAFVESSLKTVEENTQKVEHKEVEDKNKKKKPAVVFRPQNSVGPIKGANGLQENVNTKKEEKGSQTEGKKEVTVSIEERKNKRQTIKETKTKEEMIDKVKDEMEIKEEMTDKVKDEMEIKEEMTDKVKDEMEIKDKTIDKVKDEMEIKEEMTDKVKDEMEIKEEMIDKIKTLCQVLKH